MFTSRWFRWACAAAVCLAVILPLVYLAFFTERGSAGLPTGDDRPRQVGEPGEPPDAGPDPDAGETALPEGAERPVQEEQQAEQLMVLQLFFAGREALESGRAGEYGFVEPVRRTLPFHPGVLRLALQELIRGPLPEESHVGPVLPESTRLLNLELKDGTAIIDFSADLTRNSPGGTLGATLVIQALVLTATQFPTVERVQVLVEGHPWEDGHYAWNEPLSRRDLAHIFSH